MRAVRTILLLSVGLGLGLLVYKFLQENAEQVVVDFWVLRSQPMSLGLAILLGVVVGGVLPLVLLVGAWWSRARRESRLKRRIRDLEREVAQTRNIAITSSIVPTADAPEVDLPSSDRDERAKLDRIAGEEGDGS